MKGFYLLLLMFCSISYTTYATDVKEIIAKMHNVYGDRSYSYRIKYKLYKGHTSKEVHSNQMGEVLVNKSFFYQRVDQTEFINGNGFYLKISNAERAMVLEQQKKENVLPVDIDAALKECSDHKIYDKEGYYVIWLYLKEYSQVPCSKIRMAIKKSDFTLRSLDLFYTYQQDFSENFGKQDLHQPHLRLEFDKINFTSSSDLNQFELKHYIRTYNSILSPKGKYEGFELFDNRVK